MPVQYYEWTPVPTKPPILLRRTQSGQGIQDEALLNGAWEPTDVIVDASFGNDDDVERVAAPPRDVQVPLSAKAAKRAKLLGG